MNKKKTQTMAFSNLIGSILFLALGIWAWFQTDGFPEVANTYVQASTFPRIMIVGMLIFAAVLFVQSILKLMGTLKDTDPLAVQVSSLNPLKDKGVAMAYVVIVLCVLFAALFKGCGYLACAFVLSMAIMYIIGKRKWLQMVLVSLLVPLGMWLIFYKVLTVNIPLGPLNFLRTLVDMI